MYRIIGSLFLIMLQGRVIMIQINLKKILLLIFCCMFFTACGTDQNISSKQAEINESSSEKPYCTVDNIKVSNYNVTGINRQSFTKVPKRIICLGAGELETLIALGAEDNIIFGRSYYDLKDFLLPEYKEKAAKIPIDNKTYSKEELLMMKPDFLMGQGCVFTDKSIGSTDFWNKRGVATMIPLNTNNPTEKNEVETVEKEISFIKALGKIMQQEKRADTIEEEIRDVIKNTRDANKNKPVPKVIVIEFLGKTMVCYDKSKLAGNMVELLGGDVVKTPAVIGYENLLGINPDVIFVVYYKDKQAALDRIYKVPALQSLKAVKNGKVVPVLLEYVYSSEVRTAEGLRILAEGMYGPQNN